MSSRLGSRLVIAGTHSGVGKTTVATGLLAALTRRGARPAAAKVGPDFIDPGYHAVACGRPPRNLDPWLCGPEAIVPLAGRAAKGAEVLVVEGVMGLFDGAVDGRPSSTADVAEMIGAPVVLVVDAGAMSTSVAALVHGYATYDPRISLAGVILNRVGSAGHEILLRDALAAGGIPVLGALPDDAALRWRDRHLGLVPVAEDAAAVVRSLDRLAEVVLAHVDLDAVLAVARSARSRPAGSVTLPEPGPALRVAVASGRAFTFTYTDTLESLEAAGCEIAAFDPLADERIPDDADGLLIGGGFPEVFAAELSANLPLLADLRSAARRGIPIWAECGGLLLLARDLDGRPLSGVVPASARMTEALTLGYRTAVIRAPCPLGPAGATVLGHEFHYSVLDPHGEALELSSRWGSTNGGWSSPTMLATYLHHHPGGDPAPVTAFARLPVPYVVPYAKGNLPRVHKSSVYLPERLKDALSARAAGSGTSEAELIRRALEAALESGQDVRTERPDPPVAGRLVGVGVGPGDPDLLTVRALSALRRADRVLAPSTAVDAVGRAEAIVREAIPGITVERVPFAMAADRRARDRSVADAAETVAGHLRSGSEVAWITLGDPLVYSTFPAVAAAVRLLHPPTVVEQLPGIMAFQALASRTGTVVADERTRLTIRTALEGDDLEAELDDLSSTVVVYKGGRRLPELAALADERGRSSAAVAGELLGMTGERFGTLRELAAGGPASYLATVILPAATARR